MHTSKSRNKILRHTKINKNNSCLNPNRLISVKPISKRIHLIKKFQDFKNNKKLHTILGRFNLWKMY